MFRSMFLMAVFSLLSLNVLRAQDYSNRGLMQIKNQSESLRLNWLNAFDKAIGTSRFAGLQPLRKENEQFIDEQLSALRRIYAQGDARALLKAVTNYLQIEKQFVLNAMIPAESIKEAAEEEIEKINQQISDFNQKERVFLIEIENALAMEGENLGAQAEIDPEMNEDEDSSYEAPQAAPSGRKMKKSGKGNLPHEKADRKNRKKNKPEESEDE